MSACRHQARSAYVQIMPMDEPDHTRVDSASCNDPHFVNGYRTMTSIVSMRSCSDAREAAYCVTHEGRFAITAFCNERPSRPLFDTPGPTAGYNVRRQWLGDTP